MNNQLPLHQEVLLLALRDDKGTFSSGMYLYAVAGAMVSELMILERIICNDDKKQTVAVISDKSTGCAILDEFLTQIDKSQGNKGLQDWVFAAANMKDLNHRIAISLCDKGILKQDERKLLFVFTQRIYPELDSSWEDAIRRRMSDVMFHPAIKPDPRTGALIAFAYHADLLKPNFALEELRQHKDHVKKLANGEILAAGATKNAIEAIQAAIMVATVIPAIVATTTSH